MLRCEAARRSAAKHRPLVFKHQNWSYPQILALPTTIFIIIRLRLVLGVRLRGKNIRKIGEKIMINSPRAEYNRIWARKHKKYFTDYRKKWYQNNKDNVKKYQREHKQKYIFYHKKWVEKHKEFGVSIDRKDKYLIACQNCGHRFSKTTSIRNIRQLKCPKCQKLL
jgi:hypothetical protein